MGGKDHDFKRARKLPVIVISEIVSDNRFLSLRFHS